MAQPSSVFQNQRVVCGVAYCDQASMCGSYQAVSETAAVLVSGKTHRAVGAVRAGCTRESANGRTELRRDQNEEPPRRSGRLRPARPADRSQAPTPSGELAGVDWFESVSFEAAAWLPQRGLRLRSDVVVPLRPAAKCHRSAQRPARTARTR